MNIIFKYKMAFSTAGLLLGLFATTVQAQQVENPVRKGTATTFAIIVDNTTLSKARKEIDAYKAALEKQGLGTYVVSHSWNKPEEVKVILQKLYAQKPALEGAVFIGDIPIPMVMDAQRLTSAYKFDQARFGLRAAVPSDRFYDDFDLKFNFIKRDSIKINQFYYSLAPNSAVVIDMDIYTGRIKAPLIKGKDKYEMIKAYLTKVVSLKEEQNRLTTMMVYSGMGYASESQTTWASEQVAMREQLPDLFKPGSSVKFVNSRMQGDLKQRLLSEMQREDLDLAIFHQHGESDVQVISGYPNVSFPQPSIENVRRYLRSKIQMASRKKQNVDETKKRFETSLGVPMSWMNDALTDSVVKADSLFEANGNIMMEDIDQIHPNARMLILDNCYNGSFHKDDYMSGHYIFGEGKTVVAMANSINVLQDVWTTDMIGLLQHGVRAGNWFKQQAYLETHLIGDPTFAFATQDKTDYNDLIVNKTGKDKVWQQLLQENDADLQSLALVKIFSAKQEESSELLKQTYYASPFSSTRTQAWKLLSQLNNADFKAVLKDAVNDPYEYLRRRSVNTIGDFGTNDLVPALVQSAVEDWASKRVSYNSGNSLSFMDSKQVIAEMEQMLKRPEYANSSDIQRMIKRQQGTLAKIEKENKVMSDAKTPAKERAFTVNMLRTYTYHQLVPEAIRIATDKAEEVKLRLSAVEALGWFPYSYQKNEIIKMCDQIIADKDAATALRDEALRTKTYLLAYTSPAGSSLAAK